MDDRLIDLASKWRQAASAMRTYHPESAAAHALIRCAEQLTEAIERDFGDYVPIDSASRLTGLTKDQLRRVAQSHPRRIARKSGTDRWLFKTSELWHVRNGFATRQG